MNPATLKTVLLSINITLAIAILCAGGMLLKGDGGQIQKDVKTISDVQVTPYKATDDAIAAGNSDMSRVFRTDFTAPLGEPVKVEVQPTVKKEEVKATSTLEKLVTIKGINWSGDETSMIFVDVKGKEELLAVGDAVPGVSPKATFLRCSGPTTAVFEYGGKEVELSMDLEPKLISSPIDGAEVAVKPTMPERVKDPEPEKPAVDEGSFLDATYDESTSTWKLPEQEVNWVFENLESLKQQMTFAVDRKAGEVIGLRIARMDGESLPQRRGFRQWDTIVSVNNKKVASTNELYQLQHDPDIQRAEVITVVYIRDGQQQTMNFRIK